jgi:hypothetical protein
MGSALNDLTQATPSPVTDTHRRPDARQEPTDVQRQLLALIEDGKRGVAVDSALLMSLYRQLEPVSVEFMLGTWHGSLFNGQTGDGWWGKNMISAELVQPLLFQREDGSVYSNDVWGMAHMTTDTYEDLSETATLVYNDKPLYDLFRRLTDETVIGFTPAAVAGTDFFFQLTRDHQTKVVS